MLQSVVIQPSSTHTATLIFLHGLGDSGHGWSPVMRMISKAFPFMKFVLPHAPSSPVTINGGMRMPSWYDIRSLSEDKSPEDEAGMMQTRRCIDELVLAEVGSGVPLERVIVGGFSQGGAMSLLFGLTGAHKVGATVSLSAYLPLRSNIAAMAADDRKGMPIFMGHGTADFVVHHQWGKHSADHLKSLGYSNLTFKSYENLDHSSNDLELEDLKDFLSSILDTKSFPTKETL